jgi:hypothetical protein
MHEDLITFQIPIGLPPHTADEPIISRRIDARDVPEGRLYLCQLRGRTLPVAAAKFAAQMEGAIDARFA